jgi:hypothetical protein
MRQKTLISGSFSGSLVSLGVVACLTLGCADPNAAEKDQKQSIIGRKTQEIGEFDADGDAEIADQQVEVSANPLAAAGAYGYAVGTISKQAVQRALQLFNAEHERYPKDHEEFMERIIKANNLQLPVLPGGDQYQYDVENHELVIIEGKK